jgi:hypothetical protein
VLELLDDNGRTVVSTHAVPGRIELDVHEDHITLYRVRDAVCRTVPEAQELYGRRASPYEWVGLMNRYLARRARLTLVGLGDLSRQAFASLTDLGTGLEEPAPVDRSAGGDELRVVVDDCPARSLLRIYWPLEPA